MDNFPTESQIEEWRKEAADAGGIGPNFRILSLCDALKTAYSTIIEQSEAIGRYVSERGRMAGKLESSLSENVFGKTYPTDTIIQEWMDLARTRLDEGHPADPAALSAIITLCEMVLDLRHPKKVFQNLLHHGNPE